MICIILSWNASYRQTTIDTVRFAGQLPTPQPSAQGHICQNFTKLLLSNREKINSTTLHKGLYYSVAFICN